MQIATNMTGMLPDVCVATDRDAQQLCVVVIKGTFETDAHGVMTVASVQRGLNYADEHYGSPESTAVRYECDFAQEKTRTDVIVVGNAVSPTGLPIEEMFARLVVQGLVKDLLVVGDRFWKRNSSKSSRPEPFTEMPLTFERAFGGEEFSDDGNQIAVERRNPVGVGFRKNRAGSSVSDEKLPNLEHPRQRIQSPRDRPDPIGVGCVGRSWKPRIDYAGTYNQRWLDEVCPFLPDDFDSRYFQCAPEDQQFPIFQGGELIRCVHMSTSGTIDFQIPNIRMPVQFRFSDRIVEREAQLDTVVLLPNEGRALLTWRSHARLGKKWNRLREILVGAQAESIDDGLIGYVNGKPHFRGLGSAIRWLNHRPA